MLPGSAERIFNMAEAQQRHQHGIDRMVARAALINQRMGILCASVVTLGSLSAATYLLATGKPVTGLIALLVPLTGLASLFVTSLNRRSRPRKNNSQDDG